MAVQPVYDVVVGYFRAVGVDHHLPSPLRIPHNHPFGLKSAIFNVLVITENVQTKTFGLPVSLFKLVSILLAHSVSHEKVFNIFINIIKIEKDNLNIKTYF